MIDWKQFAPSLVFGLDEVGRGCLAGPVVSAAVTKKRGSSSLPGAFILSPELPKHDPQISVYHSCFNDQVKHLLALRPSLSLDHLTDSKQLTDKKRSTLLPTITHHYDICIGISGPKEIDRINILQASLLSMRRAAIGLERALGEKAKHLLIDGSFKLPNWDGPQTTLIQGDLNCDLISAASVVAKVFRDNLMLKLDSLFPAYGLSGHKGYPSPRHRKALLEIGPCPIHRMSFKGVLPQPEQLIIRLPTSSRGKSPSLHF